MCQNWCVWYILFVQVYLKRIATAAYIRKQFVDIDTAFEFIPCIFGNRTGCRKTATMFTDRIGFHGPPSELRKSRRKQTKRAVQDLNKHQSISNLKKRIKAFYWALK